jgi:Flp pilus assembly protein TadD/4-amino-4-deoxy-L-arabinose transferase-like glycosyltransferase
MPPTLADRIRSHRGILAVLGVALLIRVVYLCLYRSLPDWDMLSVDNYYHHHWAMSIADGNLLGDTTYFRAPFYVFCLAFLYWLFGTSLWVGRIFGLGIGLSSIILTYLLAGRLFGRRVATLSALIQSLYPVLIYFESELLLDPILMLLLQAAVLCFFIWLDTGRRSDGLWTGLFLALASVTRPTVLVLAPVMVLFWVSRVGIRRELACSLGAFLAPLALIVGATFVRNVVVADDPVLIASQGGINLYISNNDDADGLSAVLPEPMGFNWRIAQVTYLAEQESGRRLRPGEMSSFWTRKAVRWMADHPDRCLSLYLQKLYHSISNREISNNRSLRDFFAKVPLLKFNPLSFGLIFALAVAGILIGWRDGSRMNVLLALMLVYILATSLFFVNSRFRLPLVPFYIVLAALGADSLIARLLSVAKQAVIPILAAAAVAALVFIPVVPLPKGQTPGPLISGALYFYAEGDYRKALAELRRAKAIDPAFPELNLNLGVCFLRMGQEDSAFEYFGREKLFHPLRPKAYANTASLMLVAGRHREASLEAQKALQLAPYDATANMLLLRASAFLPEISPDSLKGLIFEAAARTGDDVFLLNDGATLLLSRGDTAGAEALLDRARISRPPPIETDDAAFDRDFRNSPQNWEKEKGTTYYLLGYLAGRNGRYGEAVSLSREAIGRDPELADAWVNLVSGYLSCGDVHQADSVLKRGLALFPKNENLQLLSRNILK